MSAGLPRAHTALPFLGSMPSDRSRSPLRTGACGCASCLIERAATATEPPPVAVSRQCPARWPRSAAPLAPAACEAALRSQHNTPPLTQAYCHESRCVNQGPRQLAREPLSAQPAAGRTPRDCPSHRQHRLPPRASPQPSAAALRGRQPPRIWRGSSPAGRLSDTPRRWCAVAARRRPSPRPPLPLAEQPALPGPRSAPRCPPAAPGAAASRTQPRQAPRTAVWLAQGRSQEQPWQPRQGAMTRAAPSRRCSALRHCWLP